MAVGCQSLTILSHGGAATKAPRQGQGCQIQTTKSASKHNLNSVSKYLSKSGFMTNPCKALVSSWKFPRPRPEYFGGKCWRIIGVEETETPKACLWLSVNRIFRLFWNFFDSWNFDGYLMWWQSSDPGPWRLPPPSRLKQQRPATRMGSPSICLLGWFHFGHHSWTDGANIKNLSLHKISHK